MTSKKFEPIVRYISALGVFVATLEGILAGVRDGQLQANPAQFDIWNIELPRLNQDVSDAKRAWLELQKGNSEPIFLNAQSSQGLGKRLDGFDLNFAGIVAGKLLDQMMTEVVVSAYAVIHGEGAVQGPSLPSSALSGKRTGSSPDELLATIEKIYVGMGVTESDARGIAQRIQAGLSNLSQEQRQNALEAITSSLSRAK